MQLFKAGGSDALLAPRPITTPNRSLSIQVAIHSKIEISLAEDALLLQYPVHTITF
jgi:hypothetical protein